MVDYPVEEIADNDEDDAAESNLGDFDTDLNEETVEGGEDDGDTV